MFRALCHLKRPFSLELKSSLRRLQAILQLGHVFLSGRVFNAFQYIFGWRKTGTSLPPPPPVGILIYAQTPTSLYTLPDSQKCLSRDKKRPHLPKSASSDNFDFLILLHRHSPNVSAVSWQPQPCATRSSEGQKG